MAESRFSHGVIRGIVCSVPVKERRIDDEIALFGGNATQIERIKKTIGLNRRRVAEPGVTAADLCGDAAGRLLERCGADPADIDALICVTQNPDYAQPCNAAVLQAKLGMPKSCAAFDVNLGCSGYVYALWLAYMMVETGGLKNVVVLAGDTISRIVNPRDRSVAPLFGDGGSATLVSRSERETASWFSLNTDGSGYRHLIVPAGAFRNPRDENTLTEAEDEGGNFRCAENLFMDGAEIFTFSITEEPAAVRRLLEFAALGSDAIDYFVFHQANRYILGNIAKRLKIDESRVPMATVEKFGNQSSASIPSAICYELSDPLRGSGSKRLLLSGFGVGLSWASAIADVGPLAACDLVEFGR